MPSVIPHGVVFTCVVSVTEHCPVDHNLTWHSGQVCQCECLIWIGLNPLGILMCTASHPLYCTRKWPFLVWPELSLIYCLRKYVSSNGHRYILIVKNISLPTNTTPLVSAVHSLFIHSFRCLKTFVLLDTHSLCLSLICPYFYFFFRFKGSEVKFHENYL